MTKSIAIALFVIIILAIVGYAGYNRITSINFGGKIPSEKQLTTAENLDYIAITQCISGPIPFLPRLGGKIEASPINIKLAKGNRLTVLNEDNKPHVIKLEGTSLSKSMVSKERWIIDTNQIESSGIFNISCDGLLTGSEPVSFILLDPF